MDKLILKRITRRPKSMQNYHVGKIFFFSLDNFALPCDMSGLGSPLYSRKIVGFDDRFHRIRLTYFDANIDLSLIFATRQRLMYLLSYINKLEQ